MKTSELIDGPLDWAVFQALKPTIKTPQLFSIATFGPLFGKGYKYPCWGSKKYSPSTDWKEGGWIIEREKITTLPFGDDGEWLACKDVGTFLTDDSDPHSHEIGGHFAIRAETPLIAAMRCFVASKLGDEVEIPKELL